MYFYQKMFNPTYVNGNRYAQKQVQDELHIIFKSKTRRL